MNLNADYIEIYPYWINVDGNTINSADGKILTSVLYKGILIAFHEMTSDSKQNVFAVDLNQKKLVWKIEENPIRERDHLNPYVGLLRKLCTDNYIVLSKQDSWRVAVDPNTGKILTDIDLNKGNRPW